MVRGIRHARLLLVLALLGLLLAILPAAPLAAAGPITYVVTNTLDTINDANCAVGSCTLRQAVNASNANDPGAGNHNTITFAAGVTGTITRGASGQFELARDVTIAGPGARVLTVTRTVKDTTFYVDAGVTASIGGLTLSSVSAGIFNLGTVTVTDSAITGNTEGIFNQSTLTVTGSTFSGNSHGILNNSTLTVTNSTFTGHTNAGVFLLTGVTAPVLTNSTFAGNLVGIQNQTSVPVQVRTSIVAGNTTDTSGPYSDQGHNLIGGTPLLGALANNGGPTDTLLPQAGSPAIDAGGTAANGCPASDQRGVARPQGAQCDIGAVEVVPFTTVVNSASDGPENALNCAQGNATTCRLRDAIAVVNQALVSASPTPTISFALPAGPQTITLITAQLTLSRDMTIDGTGNQVAIDGGCNTDANSDCTGGGNLVFRIGAGIVTLRALTIQHGTNGISITGGATATVTNSTLAHNSVNNYGGAIWNSGTLVVTNSTFANNFASRGGGGIFNFVGTVTVTNSTFANNSASLGGGIFTNPGTVTVTNSTFAGTQGGGIYNSGATVTVTSTILASNAGGEVYNNSGTVTDGGHNLVDDGSLAGGTGDTTGPALLGPLGDYGSTTQTIPLLPGSAAIDAGAAVGSGPVGATVPATDQRGIARVGTPDIGAFESQGFTLTMVAGSTPQSTLVGTAFAQPLALTVASVHGEPVQGGVVAFAATPAGNGASATLSGPTATIGAGGAASVTATANGTAGAYAMTASATGATSAIFSLTNTAPTITLAPTSLPGAVKGIAYSPTTISANGGTAAYTFSVTTGALPGGLTLDPTTGVLSGTPTAIGTFTFTVTATDANTFTGTQAFTITVTAAPLVSIAVAPNPATLKVGQVQPFTATGTYADSSTADLTSQVAWTSDAPTIVSVDTTGTGTGKAAGTAHLTATQGAVSGQATVTVGQPVLTGVQPAPAPQSRPSGASTSGTATTAPAPAPNGSPTTGGTAPVAAPRSR